jgi:hypothetical protein
MPPVYCLKWAGEGGPVMDSIIEESENYSSIH